MALRWRVIEDNGGGLHLAVFDGDRCIYYRYGYEKDGGEGLRSDLGVLRRGIDPREDAWDLQDDVDDPQAWYDALRVGQVNGGVVVADELGIYPERMGTAARLALTPDINIDDYITTYSDGRGQEHEAIQLPWHVVEDILSHEHTGAAEEDRWLIDALRAAGAPDWVQPGVEGWVDEHGWGIYAPIPYTERLAQELFEIYRRHLADALECGEDELPAVTAHLADRDYETLAAAQNTAEEAAWAEARQNPEWPRAGSEEEDEVAEAFRGLCYEAGY